MKPVTKRPIPKTLSAWRKELTGLERFVYKVNRLKKDNGDKWAQGMLSYVETRIADLKANKPTGDGYKRQKRKPA